MYKKTKQIGLILFNWLLIATTVFAQSDPTEDNIPKIPEISTLPGPSEGNVSQVGTYVQQSFLPRIGLTIVSIAVFASVAFIIFGTIQLLTAYGDDEKISTAKKTLTFAVIGLIITLLSYAIVSFIFTAGFGINQIQ